MADKLRITTHLRRLWGSERPGAATGTLTGRSWKLLGVALVVLLGGCAGVPTAQLQAYSNAFDEAKSAAALVYADAAPALIAGGLVAPQFSASLGPKAFDRDGCGTVVASIEELRARCRAMVALKAYNQALLDIAAGKVADDILAQIDQAFRSVSSLAAVAPDSAAAAALGPAAAIFPALKGILGEALRLRDRAALQSALMQATPQIRILIQSLRDDVDRLYAVRRAYAELELTGIKNAIDRNLTPAFRMRARHAQPTDAVVVSTLGLLEQRFNDVFNAPEPSPGSRLSSISPATTAGDTPLDGSGVELIDRQLRAANANVVEFKAAVVQFNRSVDALARYDSLLAAVDDAFTKLVSASNNPFATGGGTEQLIHSLVTIRDQARDIKQLLAAR